MSRDYKHKKRQPEKKPVPGWLWMLSGLLIGLLVALLVYLSQQPGSQQPLKNVTKAPVTQDKKPAQKKTPPKPTPKNTGLRYEFYTVLPESEVVIPNEELEQRESIKSPAVKHQYLLQAGSFRRQQEAESLKARLALIGIESGIETVEVNGDTWHRIRIGPFTSIRDVNTTRNRLRNNDINAILIRSR